MSPIRAKDSEAAAASDRSAASASDDATCLRVIASLIEAFLPALPEEAKRYREQGNERMAKFFDFPGPQGHSPVLAEEVLQLCKKHLPAEKWATVKTLMWLLSTRFGTVLLGGHNAFVSWLPPLIRSFDQLSAKQREAILLSWKTSPLAPLKTAFKALQGVHMFVLFAHSTDGKNPLWPLIGYPGADPFKPKQPSKQKLESEATLLRAIVDLSERQQQADADISAILQKRGLHVDQDDSSGACTVHCDAVVVGSGAGGGTAAGVLAQAGLKVIVIEKGTYTKAADLTTLEKDAYDNLYERGGVLMATEDGGINIMAGATVGGGTRINWSVSFKTPAHVRKEWAEVNGLPHFTSERYDRAMDAVCKRLGVDTGVSHNKANNLLWEGLESLGADVEEMPRNCKNSERCGHCPHGCSSGEKQDTTATFLADAAAAGAKILTGCFVEKVLLRTQGSGKQAAKGVLVRSYSSNATIIVKAPIVVASAGSLHTPALLLRSGISCQGNVGKHLHLHCGAAIAARFPIKDKAEDPDEGRVNLWEGPQMSTYSRQVADWADSGYGPLVSMSSAHPGLLAAGAPWDGAVNYRESCGLLPWLAVSCTYIRDKDSGKVTIGPDGLPRVHYWPSEYDQRSILKGLELNARAMAAAGAVEMFASMPGPNAKVVGIARNADSSLSNPDQLENFIRNLHVQGSGKGKRSTDKRLIRNIRVWPSVVPGVKRTEIALFSLHQMGSCRMGSSVADSVVDGEGECWECQGLYVADASAFPTASGVNPMITAESIAWMTAEGIATRFKESKADAGQPGIEIPNGSAQPDNKLSNGIANGRA